MRTPHILIVDDDRDIRDLVGKVLERDGFRISRAEDWVAARRVISDAAIDLIVLDIMMRGKDGLTFCRELRAQGLEVPIIMLTARGDDIDRILGLEMGADDYLAKPFNSRELTARIRAVLRRTRAHPPDSVGEPRFLRFDGWRLDTGKRDLVSPDDVVVPLSGGEFELLFALARRPQRTLSRDQLLDLTQGRSAVLFDRSIDILVSRLRRKLGEDPRNPRLIKTVRGGGYLFSADVAEE